jgi:hypothetical protein
MYNLNTFHGEDLNNMFRNSGLKPLFIPEGKKISESSPKNSAIFLVSPKEEDCLEVSPKEGATPQGSPYQFDSQLFPEEDIFDLPNDEEYEIVFNEEDQSQKSFSEKEDKVEIKRTIISQKQWKVFEIGKDQLYEIYIASPLISCSAYLFRYITPDKKDMVILYHALSGIPNELGEIVKQIKKDGVDLKDVTLEVESSDRPDMVDVIKNISTIRDAIFDKYHFPKENCIVKNAGFSCYCVDTHGNHGLVIMPHKHLELQKLLRK